jgi:hypothetical protein
VLGSVVGASGFGAGAGACCGLSEAGESHDGGVHAGHLPGRPGPAPPGPRGPYCPFGPNCRFVGAAEICGDVSRRSVREDNNEECIVAICEIF